MHSAKKITVTIDKCGRPTIEAHGFTGTSCKSATKPLEDAFQGGASVVHEKPELHLPEQTHVQSHLSN